MRVMFDSTRLCCLLSVIETTALACTSNANIINNTKQTKNVCKRHCVKFFTTNFSTLLSVFSSLLFPEKISEPHKSPVSPQVLAPAPAPSPVPLTLSPCKAAPAHASPPNEPSGHAAALKTTPKPAAVPTAQTEPSVESEEEKAKKLLYCSLCKVAVNSLSQLEAHNTGVPNICLCIALSLQHLSRRFMIFMKSPPGLRDVGMCLQLQHILKTYTFSVDNV